MDIWHRPDHRHPWTQAPLSRSQNEYRRVTKLMYCRAMKSPQPQPPGSKHIPPTSNPVRARRNLVTGSVRDLNWIHMDNHRKCEPFQERKKSRHFCIVIIWIYLDQARHHAIHSCTELVIGFVHSRFLSTTPSSSRIHTGKSWHFVIHFQSPFPPHLSLSSGVFPEEV